MNKPATKNKSLLKVLIRCLKCAVIAIIAFTLIAAWFLYFNIYLPQGTGPAGPHVPSEPFSRIWSQQDILLLGLGDSITDGFGADKGFLYFDRLIKNPDNDSEDMTGKNLSAVFPNLKARNKALSCSDSLWHFKQIQELPTQPPEVLGVVVMTTGGNDLIHNYGQTPPQECAMYGASLEQAKIWIQNFEKRLDQMIFDINKKFPGGCHIFLANIYDPSDGTGDTKAFFTGLPSWPDGVAILKVYNDIISNCARKYDYVHLVNIHDVFLGHGIHCRKFWLKNYQFHDPHYWYYMNIEDPNPRGFDAIRRLFLLEMIKVFEAQN